MVPHCTRSHLELLLTPFLPALSLHPPLKVLHRPAQPSKVSASSDQLQHPPGLIMETTVISTQKGTLSSGIDGLTFMQCLELCLAHINVCCSYLSPSSYSEKYNCSSFILKITDINPKSYICNRKLHIDKSSSQKRWVYSFPHSRTWA